MEQILNHIELSGTVLCAPEFSHENHGTRFFSFILEVARLSGTVDRLRVLCSEALLEQTPLCTGSEIAVSGQVRSFNQRTGERRRLVISVFAAALVDSDGPPQNQVELIGALCKDPIYRRTPLGREICDAMLAVDRPYHRTDYLPCIFWGKTAQKIAALPVGTQIHLQGRLQSRDYVKLLEDRSETRTAYEISAILAEPLTGE